MLKFMMNNDEEKKWMQSRKRNENNSGEVENRQVAKGKFYMRK